MFHPISFNGNRLNLVAHQITSANAFIEFLIQFQSNQLIYDKGYNIRQQMIYSLILLLRDEGMGNRKISYKLNGWRINTKSFNQ